METPQDSKKTDQTIIPGDSTLDLNNNSNLRILYITLAIIIGIFLLWIFITLLTKEDAIKILGEMNKLTTHTPAVSDTLL